MLNRLQSLQVVALGDHRLLDVALELVRAPDARELPPGAVVERLAAWPAEQVHAALARHGLHALWLEAAIDAGVRELLPRDLERLLTTARNLELVRSMVLNEALARAAGALDQAGVTWLTFKGMHLARALYATPHVRTACDIDLLVPPAERRAAVRALQAEGFSYRPNLPNDDHEGTLSGHGAVVDLHWQQLRPGRARIDLAALLLDSRERLDHLWVPSRPAALTVLLLHPALTEHVTGSLNKAVDLDRWLRAEKDKPGANKLEADKLEADKLDARELEAALAVLERAGLRTAGWAMLAWTRLWLGTPVPADVWVRLAPGLVRQAYVRAWLALDPPRLYRRWPDLVRGGFSLALQDGLGDLWRGLRAGRALWRR